MRIAVARTALAAAGLAVVGLTGSSFAATTPVAPKATVMTDPAGDTAAGVAPGDIVKLTFTSAGTTVAKKYTPKAVVISMELQDAIDTSGTTLYEIDANLPGCSYFTLVTQPGSQVGDYSSCGSESSDPTATGTDLGATADIQGKVITWTLPFASLPDQLKAGATFDTISAVTGTVDPVEGAGPYLLSIFGLPGANDTLTSDQTYKIG